MATLARRWSVLHSFRAAASIDPSQGTLPLVFKRWATKKAGGSTDNGKDSKPKYLGLKKSGGQGVIPGNIIIRQRGTKFHPGDFVGMGRDRTIYALVEGRVRFETNKITKRKWVHVDPSSPPPLHPLFREPEKPKKPRRPTLKQQRMKWWKQDHSAKKPVSTVVSSTSTPKDVSKPRTT